MTCSCKLSGSLQETQKLSGNIRASQKLSGSMQVQYSSGGAGYKIGPGLKLDPQTNTLSVDTASVVEADNTKPITSAAVYTAVGNINVLLSTI